MFYQQLPARSPIPGTALPRLAMRAFGGGADPRSALHSRLLRRYAADGGLLCSKGTHALQLALDAVRRADPNDLPVLLPAYTCYEVATAAIGANVKVALYDVDPNTLQPDWQSVRAAGKQGAAALVVAPLYGMPLDWSCARSVANELHALLIEDAAQAHGTTWNGQRVGSFGDVTVLSFGRGKGWTGGGGGALLWRGAAGTSVMSRVQLALHNGRRREAATLAALSAQWLLARPGIYGLPASLPFLALGETIYHDPTEPIAMTRAAAALLLATESLADDEVLHRRSNGSAYTAGLESKAPAVTALIGARAGESAGLLRFPLRRAGGWDALKRTRAPSLGAAPGYPTSLQTLPAMQPALTRHSQTFPGAELLVRELVTLPTHSRVTGVERRSLIKIAAAP